MYIVEFHNLIPNDEVDRALDDHKKFLAKCVEKGIVIAAGPKIPRDGGIMVIANIPRAELDAMLAEDPFLKNGSARCEILEFRSKLDKFFRYRRIHSLEVGLIFHEMLQIGNMISD